MSVLKVISLFSGVGAYEKALKKLNIPFRLVAFAEKNIKPLTSFAYCLIQNVSEDLNLGDVTAIEDETLEKIEDFDLLVYSPPCQPFSVARSGSKTMGFDDERGILFFDALRVIKAKKPAYCMMENVSQLFTKQFENEFAVIKDSLSIAGYNNYIKVLNAKDYNCPQNRSRLFVVSIRKDIDDGKFNFPEPVKLEKYLVDILENEEKVPKNLYLAEDKVKLIRESTPLNKNKDELIFIGGIQTGSMWIDDGKFFSRNFRSGNRIYDASGIACTQTHQSGGLAGHTGIYKIGNTYRRLSNLESFRLMGFDDDDYYKLNTNGFKSGRLYELMGNSIAVDNLIFIFKELLKDHLAYESGDEKRAA